MSQSVRELPNAEQKTGIIFDISHYMLEDGPGIRTNIFMKGCYLRCQWCSNVYGLERDIQTSFDRERCVSCDACVARCPAKALGFNKNDAKVEKNFHACINCMKCVEVCPTKAHKQIGRVYTVSEVVKEVEKDRMFYRRGNGGVTMSGGEILMQPEFVIEVLKQCSNAGINTAIETSAFGKWQYLSEMIAYCDTVFIDCKSMDASLHKMLTGVDNAIILENIRLAAIQCKRQSTDLVVRLPLIPGKNDTVENLKNTASFVNQLEGQPLLNVLPYHNFGVGKYVYLGKTYELDEIEIPGKAKLQEVEHILKEQNVKYSIGGYNI